MLRQVWIYMDERDQEEVLQRLSATHGLMRLNGRFFKGPASALRTHPEQLETRPLREGESVVHLIHPQASQELSVHVQADGPFAGWTKLDEVRSEVITLVRPGPEAKGLGPGHLQANTHAWFSGVKVRKSPAFAQWAAEAMRVIETYPSTAFDWIRIAPHALEWAQAGGTLHYLYKSVDWRPEESGTKATRPHASLGK